MMKGNGGDVAQESSAATSSIFQAIEQEENNHYGLEQAGFKECGSVEEYEYLNQIGQGTFGVVFRAREKKTGVIVALKRVKFLNQDIKKSGFPASALREIHVLLQLKHPNIVNVKEMVVGSDINKIFMVMEFVEHCVLDLLQNHRFNQAEVKCLMIQLLEGVKYLHDNWIIHRDLKPSNLLLNNRGTLKICDFGLARKYGSPLRELSPVVVTLWYRAPEILLGETKYSTSIDMWSVGCIFYELLTGKPLFPGKSELEQINIIFNELGAPNETNWPGCSDLPACQKFNFAGSSFLPNFKLGFTNPILTSKGISLLNGLLSLDPKSRLTAEEALHHPYFNEDPFPATKSQMKTFKSLSEIPEHIRKKKQVEEEQMLKNYQKSRTDSS